FWLTRCPATRARICALMYPTNVPTHSEEIGTSCSSTEATLTTGGGGAVAAPDFSPQPARAAASTTASRHARTWQSFMISVVCTLGLREDVPGRAGIRLL